MSLIYALGFFGLSEFEPGRSAECHVSLSFLCAIFIFTSILPSYIVKQFSLLIAELYNPADRQRRTCFNDGREVSECCLPPT
jgi:hypothetical protein